MTVGISDDFLFFPEQLAELMIRIGDALLAGPVAVMLDRLAASPHSAALRPSRASRSLRTLYNQLDGPLARLGIKRRGWTFSPHVTLGYRHGEPFSSPTETIAWESRDFVLIHSIVGETRHIELGRWRLAARQYELFQ